MIPKNDKPPKFRMKIGHREANVLRGWRNEPLSDCFEEVSDDEFNAENEDTE